MKSLILQVIKENENWKEILEEQNIKIKIEGDLAVFKYDIDADFSNPVVQEARGIIIDLVKEEVVCWPFRKFGNYGESYVDKIDWSSARVQEKMDGSIMKLYYYKNKWCLASNGCANAYEVKNQYHKNFGQMFELAANHQKLDYFRLNKDNTYIFELVSPDNKIVVSYEETKIYHLGTRNNKTGKEYQEDIGIIKPKEYELSSLEDCISFAKKFSAKEHEGFVVVDKNWNRIKIKSPDYIRAHYLANNSVLTVRRAIEIVLKNEDEEYLSYFPEYREKLMDIRWQMTKLIINMLCYAKKVEKMNLSRRDYAIAYHEDVFFSYAIKLVYEKKDLSELKLEKLYKKYIIDFL